MNNQSIFYKFLRGCYRIFIKPFFVIRDKKIIRKFKRNISELKNSYSGQRCFIVGNGPSLTVDDLGKLKDEVCFGSHRIYEIYDKTSWRPNFYCAQDYALIKTSAKDIENKVTQTKFIGFPKSIRTIKNLKIQGAIYMCMVSKDFESTLPDFSEDVSKCFYEGYTVTYMCLQIAVYMGFKEIYLLGVDHNYSTMIDANGNMVKQEGIKDHFSDKDQVTNLPRLDKSTLAYMSAKKYADSHGIKIYNATRGGKLEVFERIDFDRFIENKLGGEKR